MLERRTLVVALCGIVAIEACGAPRHALPSAGSGDGDQDTGLADAGAPEDPDGSAEGGDGGLVDCPADPWARSADPSRAPVADDALAGQTHQFFTLKVTDSEGNPLRGATLTTVNKIVLTTDDQGIAAFYEPGLMGLSLFFHVAHVGYEHPADGFGFRGKAVTASEGASATFVLEKTTGELAGPQGDLASRLVNGKVPGAGECFALRFVDAENGRGVPLVRARVLGEEHWSDSQGMVAFCNPDRLDSELSFSVFSYGYGLTSGDSSVSLVAARGESQTVSLTRTMLAERLYRITGAGIYRDSILLGLSTPLARPVLNGLVAGSDTASTAVYRGKLFWMWQDTDRLAYPLGNFRGTSALSMLEQAGGLSPHAGVNLDYFVDADGFAKPMSEDFGPGGQPVWMAGLVSVPDAAGEERLFAGYAKVQGLGSLSEAGLMRFDDEASEFKRVVTDFLEDGFVRPDGHAFRFAHGPASFVYYPGRLRIPATAEAMVDRSRYEQFSPHAAGGSSELVRDAQGKLDYAFRPAARHATSDALRMLGVDPQEDLDGHDVDVVSGEALSVVGASFVWNPHRERFLRISQALGHMGDLYHAEADTPMGPWVYAQRVVEHEQYTFYNPFHHPEFDQDGGRTIFVEGTYTTTFTFPEPVPTPRYNYNQVMYRLPLDEPKLQVPVALYQVDGQLLTKHELRPGAEKLAAAFFAQDHALPQTVPVAWSGAACEPRTLEASATPKTKPLFHALPASASPASPQHVALYEYRHPDGRRAYDVDGAELAGFVRTGEPLAWVWANPVRVELPVRDYLSALVADAGEDQCLASGSAVTLDASQSTAGSSPIIRYVWKVSGAGPCELVEGPRVTLQLSPGLHSIDLTVVDAAGNMSADTLIVRVH